MKIKIYNENGNVKVTRVTNNWREQTLFSSIQPGQIAEVNIEAYQSYSANLLVKDDDDTEKDTTGHVIKLENTCCHCKHSEGIEGRNSMLGCKMDGKLHDMEDTCLCFEAVYKFNTQTGLPERCK